MSGEEVRVRLERCENLELYPRAAGTSAKEEGELWRNPHQSMILERKRLSGWIEDENMIQEESINQGFSPGPKPDLVS